jgi:DNA-binding transcriptional LysR family regulator
MKTSIASAQYALTASDLEVLLALARGRTLAGAAARLAADASTVFRSTQRIEKHLGQRLFERTRQGYMPTDTMLEIARHAERIEAELEAARTAARGASSEVVGRVRLTTTDSVLRGLVLPCLPALAAKHPQLQLELGSSNELASLTRRDADLALRATPRAPDHLIGRPLGTIGFAVCGLKKAERTRASAARALQAADWIAPDEAMPEHPSVRWRRKHMPKLVPRHLVDGIVGVVDAIKSGMGVGVVPLFMLQTEPLLQAISRPLEGCESALWLLAHPESRHLRRISVVYQHLAESIRLKA